MKELIKKCEALQEKYASRREHFKSIVERFKQRGKITLFEKSSHLLHDADALVRELRLECTHTVEGWAQETGIKKKMKRLKTVYKELNEITKPLWRQWIEAIVVALGLAVIIRNFFFGLYHVPTGSAEPNILVGDRIWGNKMAYYISSVKRGDLVIFDNPLFAYDNAGTLNYLWQRYVGFPVLGFGAGPDNWVKRVIAVPGDVIEGRIEDGKTTVYVNSKKLDESYVNPHPLIAVHKSSGFLPLTHVGPFAIPSFLQYKTDIRNYTYDPSKSYEDQPYYLMRADEIVMRRDGHGPLLQHAYDPIYDNRTGVCVDAFGPYVVPPKKYWVMGDSRRNSIDSRYWLFLDEKLIHGRASFVIYSIDSEEALWLFELLKHPINFWTKHIRWNRFFKGLNGYQQH